MGTYHPRKKLERFAPFKPPDITQSNALFGYEGDKYYFDMDIAVILD